MARAIATRAAGARPRDERAGAAELVAQQIELFLKSGNQRLGRNFATQQGLCESRGTVAASGAARRAMRARGIQTIERLAIYPEYIDDNWLDPAIAPRVRAMQTTIEPVGGQP